MNTTTETIHHPARETALKWVAGGSVMEAIGALATIALAIVGLAGLFPNTMAAIATIVIGAAILLEGGAFGAGSYASRVTESEAFEGGASAMFLGGVAGIVLGILALLGIAQMTLLSVAVLVFGATFLLSGPSVAQAGSATVYEGTAQGTTAVREAGGSAGAAGGHMLVGLAAIVLGILAVIGISQLTLVLVGLLTLGAGALFSGSAVGGRSLSVAAR